MGVCLNYGDPAGWVGWSRILTGRIRNCVQFGSVWGNDARRLNAWSTISTATWTLAGTIISFVKMPVTLH